MQVSDLYPGIKRLLMGRSLTNAFMATYVQKGVYEITENFKFQKLQTSGPVVQLTSLQANYDPQFFMSSTDSAQNNVINKINSLFLYTTYYGPYVPGTQPALGGNSGYNLTFKTVDNIEVLINVPGMPIYWTRFNDQVWVGSIPDNNYSCYARYQREHPFSSPTVADTDPLYLPNSWQDILEYQSSMRAAQELNLSTKVSEFNARLNGDKQFQQSRGLEGSPGLIFQRTSQENRDQTTSRKSFRLKMGSV
ncbi:MAG TPA: hypothetical protein VII99_10510 [Bacteroidia bacterium]